MTTLSRNATASWSGALAGGTGHVDAGDHLSAQYSFPSRFQSGDGTNPEELLAAAHASCYAMALAHWLDQAGQTPEHVETTAEVVFDPDSLAVARIHLRARAVVPGIDEATFQLQAEDAKANCPISKALAAVEIDLDASLVLSASHSG